MDNMLLLLDGSGSMKSRVEITVDAVNEFLSKFREKVINVSIVVWDDSRYDNLYTGLASDVPSIGYDNYKCIGMTPLYDTFARGINHMMRSSGEKKLIVLLTDGLENSSVEFSKDSLSALIKDFRSKGNEIIFLGVSVDIDSVSHDIGISKSATRSHTGTFTKSAIGETYTFASDTATRYFTNGTVEDVQESS